MIPKFKGDGRVLAVLFAVLCILGALGRGNMFQGAQAHQMIANTFGLFTESGWLFGLILAVIVGAVIIGGIKSIAKVTEKIVPLMGVLYVGTAVIILLADFTRIPSAFGVVLQGAFSPEAIGGAPVRLFHHDLLILLWPEMLDAPVEKGLPGNAERRERRSILRSRCRAGARRPQGRRPKSRDKIAKRDHRGYR